MPNPVMKFEDGGHPDYVMAEVHKAGFAAPTPIQSQGFSIAWTGYGLHCSDRVWQNTGLPLAWYYSLQQPAIPGEG